MIASIARARGASVVTRDTAGFRRLRPHPDRSVEEFIRSPDLAGMKGPILVIHRQYDRMVPFEVSITILNHIANSSVVLLNNCGHCPPVEKPAEWTAQVFAFLKYPTKKVARARQAAPIIARRKGVPSAVSRSRT